ncbi:MAG: hypothetical protein KJN64_01955 [Ignavibacteria bacterium]|nr:hypothetical protein [Ignavibacteria bacterium]MBT8383337.1 hypothetical protein [Ignavibacteria bacterium]MBT8391409.1 hypothetical protein [Ignavibacteria bacterium]NNJ52413.1 hypothetical protein [Ignavibacteriaceae bacterium]NNL19847.1 hypothetical protein [Ignavibacteriaceae bacterium]
MARKIIGVVVGYITIFVIVFVSFTILYMILGHDGTFEAGSYQVTTTWIIISFILGLVAAILGGFVCVLIAKDRKTAYWLAGLVLVLGIALAIPALGETNEELNKVREETAGNMEAMENAKQPPISLIFNPIIGAVGVIAGSRLKKTKQQPLQSA